MAEHPHIRGRRRDALLSRAADAMVTGKSADALQAYRRLLEASPDDEEARYGLGLCLIGLGQLDEGIAELERVVSSSPDAVYDLGVAYELKGDRPKAVECFRRALALNPDDTDAREHLAGLLDDSGDPAAAAEVRRHQPAGLDEEERTQLTRLYRRRGSYLEGTIGAAVIGVIVAVLMLLDLRHDLPAGRSLWETIPPFVWALLAPFAVVAAVCFLLWRCEGGRIARWLARQEARGLSAARIEAAVKAEIDREEWQELERRVEAQEKLAEEQRRGPPWWREEASGAHLVWWAALAVALLVEFHMPLMPVRWGPVAWAVAVPGLMMKAIFWRFPSAASDEARIVWLRFYRWWGRGPLPVGIALAPGLVALLVIFW
jgi:tetratricopeptide (TPR) repeat protein